MPFLAVPTASEEVYAYNVYYRDVELGDQIPSQLLRHMRCLTRTFTVDDAVVRSLWLKCLPNNT